jgi:hypothetical protein
MKIFVLKICATFVTKEGVNAGALWDRNSIFHEATSPKMSSAPSLSRLHDYIQTHHNPYVSSGRIIGPSQRPLPDTTQQSKDTDILTLSGFRSRHPSKRAAADPRLRPLTRSDSSLKCGLNSVFEENRHVTLNPLMWRIWWARNNAGK